MPRTCGNCGPIALALAFLGSILFAFELAGLGVGVSAGATRVSLTTAGSLVASLAGLATGIRGLIAVPPVGLRRRMRTWGIIVNALLAVSAAVYIVS